MTIKVFQYSEYSGFSRYSDILFTRGGYCKSRGTDAAAREGKKKFSIPVRLPSGFILMRAESEISIEEEKESALCYLRYWKFMLTLYLLRASARHIYTKRFRGMTHSRLFQPKDALAEEEARSRSKNGREYREGG